MTDSTQRTVLVVDDEPNILRLVAFSLSSAGFRVLQASDAVTAIDLAREQGPDLVLMDVMMPAMSGLEAVQRLRADETTSDIPVVMLSARSQGYEQQAGMDAGAMRYICKPFTPKDLVAAVREVLGDA